jgi:Na+-transporting methylmalonyl-CoA/oxaloacetate decarboxylase gamma subunit/DNA-binding CsgD family transcriptional regulator
VEEIVILHNLEYWVLAQVGLEVILVLFLIFFLLKIRSMSKLLSDSQEEERSAASNLEKLSDQLALLENKRITLEETLGLLSEKASALRNQGPSMRLADSESYNNAVSPKAGGSSLRLQVEDLHLQGLSLAEIARRLGLHPTEVKMALDLARLKAE